MGSLLSVRCLLGLSEHVGEPKLTHAVSIGYLTLRSAVVTLRLEDVVVPCQGGRSLALKSLNLTLLGLFEVAEHTFGQNEITFIGVVLDGSSQDHVALLQLQYVVAFNEAALKLKFIQQVVPQVVSRKYSGVSKDYQPVLGSSQRDIQTSGVVQKPNPVGFVGSDTRKQNEILLSALETIDGCNFDLFVEGSVQLALLLHVTQNESSLTLIRSNDADLVGPETRVEERRHNLLHVLCLHSVQERGSRG